MGFSPHFLLTSNDLQVSLGMKVLLRDTGTGKYLGFDDQWVAEPWQAFAFAQIEAAGQKAMRGSSLQVVLRYDDPECELALSPEFCAEQTFPLLSRAPDSRAGAPGF